MTEALRINDVTVTPVAFRNPLPLTCGLSDRDDTGYMQRPHPHTGSAPRAGRRPPSTESPRKEFSWPGSTG
ncbi:hypothetical protein ABID95_005735 [Streptomyces atratus]